jgi:hypothetical protein
VEPKVISGSGFESLMAHPLHSYPPSDLRFQARWARLVATNVAPGHGKRLLSSAPPRPCGRATREDPALLQPLRELDGGHPLPLPARIRMPAALVAGRALRVPAGWAFGPPFPRPAAAGVAAVVESSRGSGARTRPFGARRLVSVTPTWSERRPPRSRGRPSAQTTSPVPPRTCPAEATSGRPGGATRSSRPGRVR